MDGLNVLVLPFEQKSFSNWKSDIIRDTIPTRWAQHIDPIGPSIPTCRLEPHAYHIPQETPWYSCNIQLACPGFVSPWALEVQKAAFVRHRDSEPSTEMSNIRGHASQHMNQQRVTQNCSLCWYGMHEFRWLVRIRQPRIGPTISNRGSILTPRQKGLLTGTSPLPPGCVVILQLEL